MHFRRGSFSGAVLLLLICTGLFSCVEGAGANQIQGRQWFRRGVISERMGRTDQAISSFRRSWQASDTQIDAVLHGSRLLLGAGRPNEAAVWTERALSKHPDHDDLTILRGEALWALGNRDEALALYRRAVSLRPDWHRPYLLVLDALGRAGAYRAAQEIALEGEKRTGQGPLFAEKASRLALKAGWAGETTEALLRWVTHDPAVADQALALLKSADFDSSQLDSVAGRLALARRRYSDAVAYTAVVSRLERDHGQRLFDLADELRLKVLPEYEAEAFARLTAEFPKSPLAASAGFRESEAWERAGDFDRAAIPLRRIVAEGIARYADHARVRLAPLLLTRLGDTAGADKLYGHLAIRGYSPQLRRDGAFGQGMCALYQGRFTDARGHWKPLAKPDANNWLDTQVELVRLSFYAGDPVTLNEEMGPLVSENPHSRQTNDVMALQLLLAESQGDTAAWAYAGRIAYNLRTGKFDLALSSVLSMTQAASVRGLRDWIMVRGAEAALALSRPETAVALWEQTVRDFPNGSYADDALWAMAEYYGTVPDSLSTAIATYQRLLLSYPDSPMVAKSRAAIRRLRSSTNST